MYLFGMLFSIIALVLPVIAQETSNSTDAPVTQNNPLRSTFQAVLQADKPVQGQITGVSNDNGTGVNFNVNFFNFPLVTQGPFNYHIHEYPVPASGNCTATGGHLSPFGRQETPACDATAPWTCQPGDLSGKHGNISSQLTSSASQDSQAVGTFQAMYLDLYLSTNPSNVAFFGNRSVVVHSANGTRLNCGNFTQMNASSSSGGNNANGTNTTTTPTASTTHNVAAAAGVLKWEILMAIAAGLGIIPLAGDLI
ncbi:uncharacterized protein Z520_09902 [Fonsecaea multimorphosa CBS 102226]|uniref:superoxide dismutase n=1 Tax=Fonsecaea multimorphosa CBS 102226 TaxID=1442371 RepID=A0A0D2IBJ5_9EURO|nr:uncharacterized protein Z520_09902 [Fonsecaea multimorphosa CBS 102226]KIX94516.1 hypothetical protein Z520_09902 [Fonsecaea multimorphosa CBS 102226]OAL20094.1 hypothetical protein AYO22_09244 [Fonsecaea multimorphosa]